MANEAEGEAAAAAAGRRESALSGGPGADSPRLRGSSSYSGIWEAPVLIFLARNFCLKAQEVRP